MKETEGRKEEGVSAQPGGRKHGRLARVNPVHSVQWLNQTMMQSDGKAPAHIPAFSRRAELSAEPKYTPLSYAWAVSGETGGVWAPLAAPAPWLLTRGSFS